MIKYALENVFYPIKTPVGYRLCPSWSYPITLSIEQGDSSELYWRKVLLKISIFDLFWIRMASKMSPHPRKHHWATDKVPLDYTRLFSISNNAHWWFPRVVSVWGFTKKSKFWNLVGICGTNIGQISNHLVLNTLIKMKYILVSFCGIILDGIGMLHTNFQPSSPCAAASENSFCVFGHFSVKSLYKNSQKTQFSPISPMKLLLIWNY